VSQCEIASEDYITHSLYNHRYHYYMDSIECGRYIAAIHTVVHTPAVRAQLCLQ